MSQSEDGLVCLFNKVHYVDKIFTSFDHVFQYMVLEFNIGPYHISKASTRPAG